jgi:hypothetical protein
VPLGPIQIPGLDMSELFANLDARYSLYFLYW